MDNNEDMGAKRSYLHIFPKVFLVALSIPHYIPHLLLIISKIEFTFLTEIPTFIKFEFSIICILPLLYI